MGLKPLKLLMFWRFIMQKRITFNLHFTDFCNFKCYHCFVKKQGKELSFDSIKIIIDKIVKFSRENNLKARINLAGGEPLLSKNIQRIIDYIVSNDIEVSIITNGFFLTKGFIEHNKTKLSMIGISVDSLDVQTNLTLGRCNVNTTLLEQDLIYLCSLIKSNGIKLKINICVSSTNKDEDLSSFLKIVIPDRIKILRVLGNEGDSFLITDAEWDVVKMKYKDMHAIFEDNDFMREGYLIIDSEGNLSKNNLHFSNNSLLDYDMSSCLRHLEKVDEV